jgi:hypothetical protein
MELIHFAAEKIPAKLTGLVNYPTRRLGRWQVWKDGEICYVERSYVAALRWLKYELSQDHCQNPAL